MPFCHGLKSSILKVGRTTSRGKKKKRQFEGEVH
jgi:hypothetical protein